MKVSSSNPGPAHARPGRLFRALFWAAFAAALALRLTLLDLRPLHHDEGVNGWFLLRLLREGVYRYDPANYHGPFLYYAAWLPVRLAEMSVFWLRFPVAAAGALLVPLLLPLRRWLGRAGVTAAAWSLALSPSLVYYARDFIHETWLIFFTLTLVVSGAHFLCSRRPGPALGAAASLALLLTVKETGVVTAAVLLLALALAWLLRRREPGGAEPPPSPVPEAGLGLPWPGVGTLGLALAVSGLIWASLYSSFFTHPQGLIDALRSLALWTRTGLEGAGHEKPLFYFAGLLGSFELTVVLFAAAGAVVAAHTRAPLDLFCVFWALGQIGAYSLIHYKTPWLILNMVLPLALVAGLFWRRLELRHAAAPWPRWRLAAVGAAAVLAAGFSLTRTVDLAFVRYDDEALPLVYVQTHRDFERLLDFVDAVSEHAPAGRGSSLKVFSREQWPLGWYLRGYTRVGYWKEAAPEPDGDLLIVQAAQEGAVVKKVRHRYYRRRFWLRRGVPLAVWVREDVWKQVRGRLPAAVARTAESTGSWMEPLRPDAYRGPPERDGG